ncbi:MULTISPECIES: DUF4917 family protein [Xenophilus]|uniref:DUF4917 family protein n=1 Tax=Xenophilus TaxID=151754 RepID=UPI00068D2C98|nr:DUF4917 family protein [Xenophilus azovorans]
MIGGLVQTFPNATKQNIFYLHGALPLFDTGTQVIKEQYDPVEGYLLEKISQRIEKEEYPIFVTAGNGDEKLAQIRHNPYLSHCYDALCEVDGSVITLGFGFGEYDLHILEALNRAAHYLSKSAPKLWSVYIGVYSDIDKARVAEIEKVFHAKVHTFDARTAPVWQ